MRRRIAFILVSVLGALALAELGDRLYLNVFAPDEVVLKFGSLDQIRGRGLRDRFSPHPHLGYIPTPGWQRGADRHNALGFRGPEIETAKPPGVARIVCLGGSTTYGNKVDDPEDAYPGALQRELRARGRAAEVVNAGCPGWSSLQSLINLQIRVTELSPDLVIVYHGMNDVHARLVWPPEAYRRDQSGHVSLDPTPCRWWETSSALRTLAVVTGVSQPQASLSRAFGLPPATAYSLEFWKQTRAGVYPQGFFSEVPVSRMLEANPPIYFEANLRDIVATVRRSGGEALLVTWAFSPRALTGDDPRLETPEYGEAIAQQNEVVRALAARMAVPLLDLAAEYLPDSDYRDGYHFTPAGNRHRAALLADLIEGELGGRLWPQH